MFDLVEMMIDSVRVSLTNQQRIVILRQLDAERYLPIWIGPYEAEAITIALQEIEVARPQTHDLLKNTLTTLGARLLRIEVIALREDVFYAHLVVEVSDRLIEIDSRPSDALALAVRFHAPIYVAQEVLNTAGVTPEEDVQQTPQSVTSPAPAEEPSSDRLSIFEDFLQNLDLDDLDTPHPDDEPGPDPNSDSDPDQPAGQ